MVSGAIKNLPSSKPPVTVEGRRRTWIIVAAIGAVVVLGVAIAAFTLRGSDQPRLNDNAVVLAKFVYSKKFEQLPFAEQRQYYKVLDDRDAELDQAFTDKRLNESEYRTALEAAWLGKHINRVEKYFALPPGQARVNYLDKLVEKKERKKAKPNDPAKIDADESAAELKVEKWPSDIRTQWETFHTAYREDKKAKEKAAKPASKPATKR